MEEITRKWNFDELINRKCYGTIKWEPNFLKKWLKYEDLLPLWVADMDFRAPEPITKAMIDRVNHGIFGYTLPEEDYYEAVINWFERRHNWKIQREWFIYSPGTVSAICNLLLAFSKPGDKILIQEPVYYPFKESIKNNGRRALINPLKLVHNHYEMDFEDLKEKIKDPRAKILILCNPHNPISRVWKREELEKIGNICVKNNILVISDEIHCDLIFPGYKYTPFASISEDFAQNSVTCTAGSKTFNIAGLQTSNILIPDPIKRQIFINQMENQSLTMPGLFGAIALKAAYNDCEDWVDAVMIYIRKNYVFLKNFIQDKLPGVGVFEPEGTYLIWMDFREIKLPQNELDDILKKEAKVGLDSGPMFGKGGLGFQRINIACPLSILKDALERIKLALKPYLNQ
ncbi:MalY/PatB family protein [Promethearchaeum syntrophicum]|uniref:cysteine-S-conjugate beta-lyase n=1 Tax=Promethearchaeum syntrophicum TaxID=2594042 RepID=A0A5B9D997_9ARCH|nr:Aspartate aminotransferase [Candidatus Prometheoarchaeum syntrophicum]